MKKFLMMTLATAAALTLPSYSLAQTECVPTMTVEAAQAQYDAGLASLSTALQKSYTEAAVAYEMGNAAAMTQHENSVKETTVHYESEIKAIRAELNLGWREAMDAATERHNQGLRSASEQYTQDTQANLATYNESVERARVTYNTTALKLAAQYNRAVCAVGQ